ncbi:hypothetical protein AKJ37_07915 [candidate division MSBL1 archaeon SCGC-AAA259I09]|uniref:EfeO-type cupredoxin-like domain-containing protein n=4 Tax=candidate division MSBL1 TaxID=215777 RepID=A0A133UNX5_9EURY|nr:hypothetical protein AKJ62_02110 [candidate division MSBL1 archaeon SCGC-AAA259D14]KXA93819.1 hypothetical protein AKJ66_00935 [candidate division MSBL1 archaeon SCGC-AAA259E22]KXA94146.1 hypothetical protein AKJ37_07915 [candidate division MSBL1 archaeon SCGC-AAA259I09]KXA95924.1 hypothetical protein AKJ38_04235 [candidate division MSBL1 archaeon SCGC-AAA259I14]
MNRKRGIGTTAIVAVIVVVIAVAVGGYVVLSQGEPAEFQYSNLAVNPTQIEPGGTVTVTVDVKNNGGAEGTTEVELEINGETKTKDITLDAGESQTVTFSLTRNEEGTYEVGIAGMSKTFQVGAEVQPQVEAGDQTVSDSTITIDTVVAGQSGWIVIHRDDNGSPGAVIGYTGVEEGTSNDVEVEIDIAQSTDRLYAMLHMDTGETGVYEFPDADPPVQVNGQIVVTPFNVSLQPEPDTQWTMTNNTFSPETIEIDVGDTVEIVNEDSFNHNFTAQNPQTGEVVISEDVTGGESIVFTFDTEGVWKVWCTIHSDGTETEPATSGMKGKVGAGVSVSPGDDDSGYY